MNWQNFYAGPSASAYLGTVGFVFVLLVLWTLVWKGMALWKAAREGSKVWFVVLLLVNTVGILDLLYLYVFSRKPKNPIEAPKV